MEVVSAAAAAAAAGAPGSDARSAPFRDRDVREWARIDGLTGALERARLETDSWTASTATACHHYGKVVDSRARTEASGAVRQAARRQLEVFQSRVPGGRLQVVRASASSVSSGRWTVAGGGVADGRGGALEAAGLAADFESLQLSLNPLDLSSQKSKASVGRSASRRPPTRPVRPRDPHLTAAANLHRVSRLCHQIHESAVRQAFGRPQPQPPPPTSERQSGDGSASGSGVDIQEVEDVAAPRHGALARTKSTSSDDIHQLDLKGGDDLEDLEQLQNWRRTSKIRRSLQFPKSQTAPPKPLDLPESSVSVRRIKEDLEKGRRLNTALRNNSVDLEALDQILQSISNSDKTSTDDNLEDVDEEHKSSKLKQKRDSFVTVETLQEVKCRLRRTSSPSNDIYKNNEETDDGIVTEEATASPKSRVRSYVFGMETMLNKKPVSIGTGSLESKSKLVNGTNTTRTEDWYNRRKSYGFEQVHNHDDSSNSFSSKTKNLVESSTDSGICRSSEIVLVPPATKTNSEERYNSDESSDAEVRQNGYDKPVHNGLVKKMSSIFDEKSGGKANEYSWNRPQSTTITIPIVKNNNVVDLTWNEEPERDIKRHSIAVDESKYVTKNPEPKVRRTSLAINDIDDDISSNNRKTKKVEFCKTEVHFAADSGKVNIVETDEKPPPTQNFRRRRRNSGPLTNFNEDFNKNGLPVLHFGDSEYEKTMFGIEDETESKDEAIYENLTSHAPQTFSTVTITNGNHIEYQEEEKKETENENIKGILKNKPIKPKPYHLGEPIPFTPEEETKKWSLNLRPVEKEDLPIWKSTVTVRNSFKPAEDDQTEFQKLLRNLRPTRKSDYLSDGENRTENRHSDSFSNIRIVSPAPDNRRSSWSVTDKVKIDESMESKGYSTKVNFGNGEATVVETEGHPTWPRAENSTKGREDSSSKHTMCSKMTTTEEDNSTTTTTKITIDLSPSPDTVQKKQPDFKYAKYQRSHNARFKSTSLILNTMKDSEAKSLTDHKYYRPPNKIPQQLEALKKLYEDAHSDSDADKEVQQLMSKTSERNDKDDDNNSVVSGSWSKMTAYNHINEVTRSSFRKAMSRFDLKYNAKIEKDTAQLLKPVDGLRAQDTNKTTNNININLNKNKYSPVVVRKPISMTRTDLKPSVTPENISSPLLVCKNAVNDYEKHELVDESSNKEFRNVTDARLQNKHSRESVVLRQPKKSEMTYFGINVSPKPVKKISQAVIRKECTLSSEKPDLLQHHKRPLSPSNKSNKTLRPPKYSPDITRRSKSPIYENLKPIKNKYGATKEFDNGILEELTKAADQILQAVNGYTDDDTHNKFSTDDEQPKEKLDTISETKAWKNKEERQKATTTKATSKTKVNRTSSTSSVESVSRERRRTPTTETKNRMTERPKKKTSSDSSTAKANTRARRLQRASSREALLQSHGSSSEDISTHVEAPVRKPRLIKKTKLTQLTMSNGLELKKPTNTTTAVTESNNNNNNKRNSFDETAAHKTDERILGSLPEIRHKTAVSTIRSTAEKSRERSKHRTDDSKRKASTNKDHLNRGLHSTARTPPDKGCSRNTATKTTTHKISTANIKKCQRSEGGTTKH